MLKIKDDVDLNKLEKLGFCQYNIGHRIKYKFKEQIGGHEIYNIKIDEDRIIHFNQLAVNNELPNIIYDLIQANLVEKVEE